MRVECLECGKKFSTRSMLPECPKCGGTDIELAETPLPTRDTGRFVSGHRVFADGSFREDFGSDR